MLKNISHTTNNTHFSLETLLSDLGVIQDPLVIMGVSKRFTTDQQAKVFYNFKRLTSNAMTPLILMSPM